MFFYQNKINEKDSLTLVCQTIDEGKQLPLQNGPAYALYEKEEGELTASAGKYVDWVFTADEPPVPPTPPTPPVPTEGSYIAFSSNDPFTLGIASAMKRWDGTLEYSTDTETWTEWNGTSTLSSVDNLLYLRGTGNTYITDDEDGAVSNFVITGSDVGCFGNIENLLDYSTVEQGLHPTMGDYCYAYLFCGCDALTVAPHLTAGTLSTGCYYHMFQACTSLTTAPALPAMALEYECYASMFYNCTSLTSASALPATTLADYCYAGMFGNCTSLTVAPALPATSLETYCYASMFYECSNLITAPALPATTLANYCYHQMFFRCSSLITVPALPATTLAESCYNNMFGECSELATLPALPAITLADYCYQGMFEDCPKIKLSETQTGEYTNEYRIPTVGTGVDASSVLWGTFYGTGGTFVGTATINTTYYTSNTVIS